MVAARCCRVCSISLSREVSWSDTSRRLPTSARALDGSVGGVTDQSSTRLSPGASAPDLPLPTDTRDAGSLAGLRGRKVIVYFSPAAMTPGCTTQACDFTDSLEGLRTAGYEGVGISPDKPEKLAKV